MRIALISDIHANVVALQAVLDDIDARRADRIVCAGDLVGYNAFPRETLALCREREILSVYGSHDLIAAGRLSLAGCAPHAERSARWTRDTLSDDERAELAALPGILRLGDEIVCIHSGVGDARDRLGGVQQFREHAAAWRAFDPAISVCVNGHTHMPRATLVTRDGRVETRHDDIVSLAAAGTWFINPGSVGEPRDADARASYAILDWPRRTLTFHRVAYDTAEVAGENARRLPPLEGDHAHARLTSWFRAGPRTQTRRRRRHPV